MTLADITKLQLEAESEEFQQVISRIDPKVWGKINLSDVHVGWLLARMNPGETSQNLPGVVRHNGKLQSHNSGKSPNKNQNERED